MESMRRILSFHFQVLNWKEDINWVGNCFSIFSPAFNLATNDQWYMLKEGVPNLVVYVHCVLSSFYFLLSVLFHHCFHPKHQLPVFGLSRFSIKAYQAERLEWNGRNWAGLLCGLGNGLQFMGGVAAGYAIQALPLVRTFWGIVLFGEYRRSTARTYVLLVSMLLTFVAAVGLLMASSGASDIMNTLLS